MFEKINGEILGVLIFMGILIFVQGLSKIFGSWIENAFFWMFVGFVAVLGFYQK